MNHQLEVFPLPLVAQLGTISRLEWLLRLPELDDVPNERLCRTDSTEVYYWNLAGKGLTLALSCMNPTSPRDEIRWGLHSFALDMKNWQGHWFHGVDPKDVDASALIELLSPSPEEVMDLHPMLCFPVEGRSGQLWSVMAMFGENRKLNTFSLVNSGNWREADAIPVPIEEHVHGVETFASAEITCRSGARTPESGIWEGRLPVNHPRAELMAQAPHRFVFKRAGDAMATLGLPPFDEATVVWTWRRA